jgi:cytochrome c553
MAVVDAQEFFVSGSAVAVTVRPIWFASLLLFASFCSLSAAHGTEASVDELTRAALDLDAQPKNGAAVFRQNCSRCHGQAAQGNPARGIPALAGQRFAYLVRQLADFAERDRDSVSMHKTLSEPKLNNPQTWADVAAFLNNAPATSGAQNGDGANVSLGEAIFHEQCASCHRDDARGDDDGFVPSLRNQHYSYLLKQLEQFINGHRRNVDPDLERFFASFDVDEKRAVSDYLSRLHGPTQDRKHMRSNGVVTD